ncbi:MAG: histone deacetylase [Betaproteobacteria bacterium]|nr:histone deacetylase [Betaproteobacteria bacterium]
MTLYYADHFVLPLPPGHRFPMAKYARLRERLAASGAFREDDFRVPPAATDAEIGRAHCRDYLGRVVSGRLSAKEVREIGFPWSEAMVERSRRSAGATLCAARDALVQGWSANLAGGTHHAFFDRGEGFCVFNDAAIAARAMQAEAGLARVAVIDCDVHQGNGTASILRGDESVFTFSIHGARNFPFAKEESDLDVELADGTGDGEYLWHLERGVDETLERAKPQLVIYLAGADPHEGDRLGRLKLTMRGLERRDELVLGRLAARGIPVAIAMAGGYGREIDDTVAIHAATIHAAKRLLA